MEELENGVTESVADSEPETQEAEVQQEETAQEPEQEPAQEPEIPNSVWATARKRSEREAQERIDREFEQRFAGYKNPKTGAGIYRLLPESKHRRERQADSCAAGWRRRAAGGFVCAGDNCYCQPAGRSTGRVYRHCARAALCGWGCVCEPVR